MKFWTSILTLIAFASIAQTQPRGWSPMELAARGNKAVAAGGGSTTVLEFDGSSGKVDSFSVDTVVTTWSVSFWIKPTASSDTYGAILTQGAAQGIYLQGTTSKLNFYNGGDGLSTGALVNDTWSHVTLSASSGTGTFYINGVSSGTFTASHPVFSTMGNDASSENFKGRLAQVAIYSIALNGTQAANLYNKSTTPNGIGSLLAYWKLDDVANGVSGASATFADSSGNSHPGTGGSGTTGRTDSF